MIDESKSEVVMYSYDITTAGQTIDTTEQISNRLKKVSHFSIDSNIPAQVYNRGQFTIELGGKRLFPDNFPAKTAMASASTPPDQKYKAIGLRSIEGSNEIKFEYKDDTSSSVTFSAYKVYLILKDQGETND